MREINRGLIVVRPKQPFLDWINSIDDVHKDRELKDLHEDASAYLIPEWETPEDLNEILIWCAEYVFEQELWSWYTDEDLWPLQRDAETFLSWFDIEFHSLVFDLDDESPLEHIDWKAADETLIIDTSSNGH